MLGAGAFGAVVEVVHKLDQHKYAVKVMKVQLHLKERALQEVRILASLQPHKNVLRYFNSWVEADWHRDTNDAKHQEQLLLTADYDYSEKEDERGTSTGVCWLYIQTARCATQTLLDWLREAKESTDELLHRRFVREICEGLAHVHLHGVVHGDLKPANIFFLADGYVVEICIVKIQIGLFQFIFIVMFV